MLRSMRDGKVVVFWFRDNEALLATVRLSFSFDCSFLCGCNADCSLKQKSAFQCSRDKGCTRSIVAKSPSYQSSK